MSEDTRMIAGFEDEGRGVRTKGCVSFWKLRITVGDSQQGNRGPSPTVRGTKFCQQLK